MPLGDVAPEIALLLTAVAILLAAGFAPRAWQWLGAPAALAGIALAATLLAGQVGMRTLTFSGVWAIDGASVWARMLILGATAVAVVMTPPWLRTDRRHGEYYAILLLSALGAMALAAAADLLQLLIAVLLSSVTGYTLAAYHRDWGPSVEAGMKYFLIGAFANAILAIGVALMVGTLQATGFAEIAAAAPDALSPLALTGLALTVAGVAFKLGAVPFHSWMPDVAEGAPAPAAAFLTVVPKIGAAVLLLRLVDLFPADMAAIRPLVALLAVATMTLGNAAALWQDDVRRMLGWSSVSQSGYALMAVCVVGRADEAAAALLVFLLGYAVANLAAFAVVTHLRGRTARADYAGLAGERPLAALVLVTSFLSLVGIPPLAGFIGKLALFAVTIEGGYAWLAVVAVLNTVLSLYYYLRVLGPAYFAAAPGRVATLGRWTLVAMAASGALVAGFGLAAEASFAALSGIRLAP